MTSNVKHFLKRFEKQVTHTFDGDSRQVTFHFRQLCITGLSNVPLFRAVSCSSRFAFRGYKVRSGGMTTVAVVPRVAKSSPVAICHV
jgi:hypothetical protein